MTLIGEREARILERGKQRLMACDDWLTRDELDALMSHMAFGPNLDIDGMVRDGMLFSIKLDGAEYFPRYSFNSSDYSYIEAMQMIITVLGSQKDGWGMAFWFGSSDGCLGGRQPKSVLTEDPRAVLEAAELEVCGAMHG
ncbi:hypothetical protein [Pseudomonas proteolytica]|uniref:hypothetical protein n=1 Tax=Pseudomonas proteolytica TaxID=219574 RepID=UPI0030B8FA58